MIFSKKLIGNSRVAQDLYQEVQDARKLANSYEKFHANMVRSAGKIVVNDGIVPQDVYQAFDNVTVERMRSDDGDTFLNDLMSLSTSVSIGKLVHRFRQASDAGQTQTSMSGQVGVKLDQVQYTYDGTIVPIHDTGFKRGWREWNAHTSEGFDALIDDQRESVASLRQKLADSFLDGHRDANNNVIVYDGLSWAGVRADTRVVQVSLGGGGVDFDFTASAGTASENKANFIEIRDTMWITNRCEMDLVYYVSREIASNWEREFSANYNAPTISQELAKLRGVADIKVTSKLTGNQLMAFPLSRDKIKPIVGMGVNTVAMPRPHYNSDYAFTTWAAIGFEVREDFAGRSCVMYAS